MEYAISIGVVAVFFVIFLLRRPKIREIYFETYDEETFNAEIDGFVRRMPLPTQKNELKTKRYQNHAKKGLRSLAKKKYSTLFLHLDIDTERISSILKTKLDALQTQPSVNGEPRNVALARFCLAHSQYIFCDDRAVKTLEAQNKVRTLSISEIMSMREAFEYVLIEKTAFIAEKIRILTKLYKLAERYVKSATADSTAAKYPKTVKSKLFLSICAQIAGYKEDLYVETLQNTIDKLKEEFATVCSSWESVAMYDFSRSYTPLEIYDKFEVFANTNELCKQNFLKLAQDLSDDENLDEFMLAIRVEKYVESASAGHIKVRRWEFFNRQFNVLFQKKDISMLAAALTSKYFMSLYFNKSTLPFSPKNDKSITKIFKFENTFEPIYKFQTVNFGINSSGGKLKLSPHLPKQIKSADLVFEACGVSNTLHIERANERELWLGNTKLKGIDEIKLTDRPLDITVKLPYNDK